MDTKDNLIYEYQPPKKNHKKAITVLMICVVSVIVVLALFFCFFKMKKFDSVTLELGTRPYYDVKDYMRGSSFALRDSDVDISDVDYLKVGTYSVIVSVRQKNYYFEIEIEDTTAPDIILNPYADNINIGYEYSTAAFVSQISDLAGPVNVITYQDGAKCDSFYFSKLGTYEIKICAEDINGNESEEVFSINAVDTIAPRILELPQKRYYAVGDEYKLFDFIEDITDNSGKYNVYFLVNDSKSFETTVFSDKNQYKIEIIASDDNGNVNSRIIYVDADFKPELYGTSDKVIKLNTEYNLLEGIFAWDNEEGFISDRVTVSGEVDASTEGEYPVLYSVTDQNGLTSEYEAVIGVSKKTHSTVIDYPDELIDKMLEADAFQYELLTDDSDVDLATYMYPCQIALDNVISNYRGSGFIYKIDKDYIYIGTAGHCVEKSMLKDNSFELWVYNPTYDSRITNNSDRYCIVDVEAEDYKKIYVSNSDDRAMLKLKRSQIPNYLLVYLKEINKTNENNISTDNGIYTNAIYAAKNKYTSTFSKELHYFNKTGADYEHLLNYFSGYSNSPKWLLTNEGTVPGQSGSLLYDKYGNPVASVSGRLFYRSAVIGRSIYISTFAELYNELIEDNN